MNRTVVASCVLLLVASTARADHHMHNQWLEYSSGQWEVETFVWEDGKWTAREKHTSAVRPALNGAASVSELTWEDGRKSVTITGWVASKATLISSISENGGTFSAVFKESDSTSRQASRQRIMDIGVLLMPLPSRNGVMRGSS